MYECGKVNLRNLKLVNHVLTSGWREVRVGLPDDIGVMWVDELPEGDSEDK